MAATGWYFSRQNPTGTLLAIEPDGTEHVIRSGRMDSEAGRRLLSRMCYALAAAPAPAGADARDAARYRALREGRFSFGPQITHPTNDRLTYTPEGLDAVCDEMVAHGILTPVTAEGNKA